MRYCTWMICLSIWLYYVETVEISDVRLTSREKECYGTSMGFSFSGTHEFHYESLRRRYAGCTHVSGNLEVTNLDNVNMTYDLSFLSTIKVVTGYVLLGLLNVETVPLTRLRLIRADHKLKLGHSYYSLVVALTSEGIPTEINPTPGLKELQMPALREISHGNVIFTQNPSLCHVDTIAWDVITTGNVTFKETGGKETGGKEHCPKCSPKCFDIEGIGHCWGQGSDMCQKFIKIQCGTSCPGRCFEADGNTGCCHHECAVGCIGDMDTECELCRNFRYGHKCLSECPSGTYPIGQECTDF